VAVVDVVALPVVVVARKERHGGTRVRRIRLVEAAVVRESESRC
jgi:hypothetical protein